ncbi:FAD-binding oxidoreductase [Cupriavidus sp. L7L]|nr:FAD-binding oxidoreductase [Cupriavidus sp. L7L]
MVTNLVGNQIGSAVDGLGVFVEQHRLDTSPWPVRHRRRSLSNRSGWWSFPSQSQSPLKPTDWTMGAQYSLAACAPQPQPGTETDEDYKRTAGIIGSRTPREFECHLRYARPRGRCVIRQCRVKRTGIRAAPWLFAWLRASNHVLNSTFDIRHGQDPSTAPGKRVIQASRALRALHAPALEAYRELLGKNGCDELIRPGGQLHLWSASKGRSRADRLVDELRRQQDVKYESLSEARLREMMPSLAGHVRGGICFPKHAHTVDPQRLTGALAAQFEREGGASCSGVL